MTDDQIENELRSLVRIERETTTKILNLINLAETRDLPLKRGFSSTFDWLTKSLGYSSSAAFRRLESARLMRSVPEVETKLNEGKVNLTTLSKARSAIRNAEKISKRKINAKAQAKIVNAIANQTADEAEATLRELLPETADSTHQERTKTLTEDLSRLTFNLTKDDMENLAWVLDYLSHSVPDKSHGKAFGKILAEYRADREGKPTLKAERATCEYRDPKTGRVCGSTYQVEGDHVVPLALGGDDDPRNRRCLCKRHNLLMAKYWLGPKWASVWQRRKARFDASRDRPDDGTM